MAFLRDIKQGFFRRQLAREMQPPGPSGPGNATLNLKTAKSVCVLFPADAVADRKVVEKWREANKNGKRQVRLVGYFASDIGTAQFDFAAVSAKQCNWFGAPGGEAVRRFLEDDCELLIRVGPPAHPELDYLAAVKRCPLKVGPFNADAAHPIYQLQFDGQQHPDLKGQLAAVEAIFSFTNATTT